MLTWTIFSRYVSSGAQTCQVTNLKRHYISSSSSALSGKFDYLKFPLEAEEEEEKLKLNTVRFYQPKSV